MSVQFKKISKSIIFSFVALLMIVPLVFASNNAVWTEAGQGKRTGTFSLQKISSQPKTLRT